MEIPEDVIATAAKHYAIFAFDEGTKDEIRSAKLSFNEITNETYLTLTKSALMGGFHRPTMGEFREKFIAQCRKYLKSKGLD